MKQTQSQQQLSVEQEWQVVKVQHLEHSFGALMLASIKVGMVVINVDSFWQFVVTGILSFVASYFEFIQQDVAGFISRHKKAEN